MANSWYSHYRLEINAWSIELGSISFSFSVLGKRILELNNAQVHITLTRPELVYFSNVNLFMPEALYLRYSLHNNKSKNIDWPDRNDLYFYNYHIKWFLQQWNITLILRHSKFKIISSVCLSKIHFVRREMLNTFFQNPILCVRKVSNKWSYFTFSHKKYVKTNERVVNARGPGMTVFVKK